MKYLCLDYGEKRTGVAVSDSGGRAAFPRATIMMRGKEAFFAELLALAEAEGVEAFVMGLPLRENGEESEMTRRARNAAARLARRSPLPVFLMPENLSSREAEARLREAGLAGKKLKERLDRAAAAAILESFLNLPEEKRLLA
jgi:putative Holliday junction resolvase